MLVVVNNIVRTLFVFVLAAFTTYLQVDHDLREAGHPRVGADIIVGILTALGVLIGTYGNFIATVGAIIICAVLGIVQRGRADNLSVAILGIAIGHLVSAAFAAKPLGWSIFSTIVLIIAIISLVFVWGAYGFHVGHDALPDEPYEGDDLHNGMVLPTFILGGLLMAGVIAMVILPQFVQ